jgi:acetyl-CoA carboxylase carboxyl transferase subunit beta
MSWISKILPSGVRSGDGEKRASVPEGLWKKCVKCDAVLYRPDVERNMDVCPKCDHHMRIGARRRIDVFLDPEGRQEILVEIEPIDRLKFKDKKRYRDRLSAAQRATGCAHCLHRHGACLAPGDRGLRVRFPRRLHGLCGG